MGWHNGADGAEPQAGVIADADGNLLGTTLAAANFAGTVFEIVKTASGYANTPITLAGFNIFDGAEPEAGLIADANGNLFGTTLHGGGPAIAGTVFEIVKTANGYASTPITLVRFCVLADCADGATPRSNLIADASGNLFGTTFEGGANNRGTVFEIVKTASGYASTPTILVSFCSLANCADGGEPLSNLIADANGNLFGTTSFGGANNRGTVFEIVKTANGYASTPTILVSFCLLANCADGANPLANLIADAKGNLFGTTANGGAGHASPTPGNNGGTAFEITNSGFVVPHKFAGTPGKPNCFGQSVSALARQYVGLDGAAEALDYPSVPALQEAIVEFCEPIEAAEQRNQEHH